jgi:beta-phosphoglucomutase-like phosphatase (HAD superfamily)
MDDCAQAGLRMAIVTTTSRGNVDALLESNLGTDWQRRFATVVAAEDAPHKKPDPEAYRLVLERLAIDAGSAVAIEDSSAGLRSASAVGIPVVIARSRYFADDPVPGALAVGPDLGNAEGWLPEPTGAPGRIGLAQLRAYIADAQNAAPS